jgi:glutamate synthase domain-containing protein 2/glutamate synthase domain-containing protein 1/glutamate synthase domain-containing protein 3
LSTTKGSQYPIKRGLYEPANEHDACGVGFVVNLDGKKSYRIIEAGIQVILNLVHRGAVGGDLKTGDGAGILTQIPHQFFKKICTKQHIPLPDAGEYGIAMLFFPQDAGRRTRLHKMIEKTLRKEGLTLLGWRKVPVDDSMLSDKARNEQPVIYQCFVTGKPDIGFERKLYVTRKVIEANSRKINKSYIDFSILSFSSTTINYKGLFLANQLSPYYPDLSDKRFTSAMAVVHQRYSTNTFPTWNLAQPFRFLAHNGEINTVRGNRIQIAARERFFESKLFGKDIKKLLPIVDPNDSDSASLDNALELLTLSGRSIAHAMMMLIPEAWGEKYPMGPDKRAFFEYHAGLMEPWDGPAAVAFTNGVEVGALLDRNGLRPARYTITRDNFMVLASEAGVLDFKPEEVLLKGALRPGEMILVDTKTKRVMYDDEIKTRCARKQPYRRWIEENRITLEGLFDPVTPIHVDKETLLLRQRIFGYTREDINLILASMASKGQEPVGSMGNDIPLAVLSEKPQMLYSYFKQLFAQVTNPAIDPIREELVMSTMVFIGNRRDILSETPQHCRLLKLKHPILRNVDIERLKRFRKPDFKTISLPMAFKRNGTGKDLEAALTQLCNAAQKAAQKGNTVIILSDRDLSEKETPIPALLAVAAVNRHLIKTGVRVSVGLIVETGEVREVMHLALLLGYGATAVNPYLTLETITNLVISEYWTETIDSQKAIENYIQALRKGMLKIMSKMGISTLRSYRGAQVFETVGLNKKLTNKYFTGTASRIEGIGLEEIAREANQRVEEAHNQKLLTLGLLDSGGHYAYRKDGERHLFNPETISLLQRATKTGRYDTYTQYASLVNQQSRSLYTLRGLFTFKKAKPVPLAEVEPAENIMKRFVTAAMSFGSISKEAHETLAIAMNRIGAKSNSGEGGENPERYKPLPNGDNRCSAVKQVASGRFGVTAEYLANARELQIKVAQGAKPGEGGQLPGHKVNPLIAKVRYSTPGVTLISPPPHHDIYSIEDLSQLIYDLKNANSEARVSVKLVSEVGVGTIAAGVAKGKADMVLISGYDGGTGASPLSSITHAGIPWELGLTETQHTLVLNNLRDKIRVQVDGQLKTGRDVVIGALLGAEEFGFGTTALVVSGCVMMRKCHKNTCPVGIATQDPALRKRFTGKPEHVINFFNFIAEEVREIMAELGFRTFDEMIGRSDMLEMDNAVDFWKAKGLDFTNLFYHFPEGKGFSVKCKGHQDHALEQSLDLKLIKKLEPAITNKTPTALTVKVSNANRTVGTILSHRIVKQYGGKGLPDDTITLHCKGCAGQSFGAFLAKGVTLLLEGEANDYVGKGLSGGKIIIHPPKKSLFDPSENSIAGNTLLYGATSGEVYIHGKAGERFAVRNSGAYAVIEGVGEHGCEYMTGGRVVILGETGLNFAAGMSGGIAYVFDEHHLLDQNSNLSTIDLDPVESEEDKNELHRLISNHYLYTHSSKAEWILDNWEEALNQFVKVFPIEYKLVLGEMMKEDREVEREEVIDG